MTQQEKIMHHMKTGKSINPIQALNMFGCFRLAAVIFAIKSEGHNVKTEIVYKNKKHYAKYNLVN